MPDPAPRDNTGVEAVLSQLRPAAPNFSREELLFRAGQAARRGAGWRGLALVAFIGLVLGTAGTWLGLRAVGEPKPHVRYVAIPGPARVEPPAQKSQAPPTNVVTEPSVPPTTETGSWGMPVGSYLSLRDQVLRWGVESLPSSVPSTSDQEVTGPGSLLEMQSKMLKELPGI